MLQAEFLNASKIQGNILAALVITKYFQVFNSVFPEILNICIVHVRTF